MEVACRAMSASSSAASSRSWAEGEWADGELMVSVGSSRSEVWKLGLETEEGEGGGGEDGDEDEGEGEERTMTRGARRRIDTTATEEEECSDIKSGR